MQYNFDKVIDRINTNSLKWDDNKRVFGTDDILPMWVADMDFQAPPPVIEAIQEKVAHGIFGYGIKSDTYYDAIIAWIKKKHGWEIKREWIVGATGVVPSLSQSVIAYTDPGDSILIQSPVYYPFFSLIKSNERQLVNNPLILKENQYTMDFDDLEDKLATGVKLMIFCNPHNPGGRVWQKDEVQQVVDLCRKYHVILLSDEIHSDLIFPGYEHTPAAALPGAQNIVTCFAPSKTFNLAGLAASYAVIPDPDLRKKYKRVVESIGGESSNVIGEVALKAAYLHGDIWLDELMTYLKGNLDYVTDFFDTQLPMIKVVLPHGTYLVWLDCRSLQMDQQKLMNLLVQKAAVGLSNGTVFGQGGEGFLRLNIACPRALLMEGLSRIKRAFSP